jgi:hypothetical protein
VGHALPRNRTGFPGNRTGLRPPDVRGHDQQSYQNVSRETFWYDWEALLSFQRGELERILVAAEDEWLRLVGKLNAARGKEPRGPTVKI